MKFMSNRKIIRNVNELPSWYNINKYQFSDNLDAASWYELILNRWTHKFYFQHTGIDKYKNHRIYKELLQLRESPLSLLTDYTNILLIGGGKLTALKYNKNDFAQFAYAISPVTIRKLYQYERRLKDNVRQRIRHYMDTFLLGRTTPSYTKQDKSEIEWANSFIDEPIYEAFSKHGNNDFLYDRRSSDLIHIDLSVPDKILMEQFQGYLHHIRKTYPEINQANTVKRPDFTKWTEYGILQYIDLKLWEEENNVSIPNRVMADAIYADGEKGEEMVRKTTHKIATQLMTAEYIEFLSTIAAQEIMEKNN